jgi:general secretion pathway protein L
MIDAIVVRSAGQSDLWECAPLAANPARDTYRGTLSAIAQRCRQSRVIVLLPGTMVTLHNVLVPARSASEIRMAVPFALEDQLAGKIDALYFAIGPKSADGSVPVAVIAHEALQTFLQPLKESGIEPSSIVPEPLALPWHFGTHSLVIDADFATVRTGPTSGFAIERELLPSVIQRANDAGVPTRLWCDPASLSPAVLARLIPSGDKLVAERPLPAILVTLFAAGLHATPCMLDLRQEEQSPHRQRDLQRWLPAAAIVAAALLTHVTWSLWDVIMLGKEAKALAEQSEERFRKTFPEVKRIVDMEKQAEQHIADLRGGAAQSDFLTLFAQAGTTLQGLPAVSVDGFSFQKGELELRLGATDGAALQSLPQAIADASGLHSEIRELQEAAGGNTARLMIGAGKQ